MTNKKSSFNMSEAQVMLEIRRGPKTISHFVRTRGTVEHKEFCQIIESLKSKKKIKEVSIDSFKNFVTYDWEWTDEFFLKTLHGKCRKTVDGCLEWIYKTTRYSGPKVKPPYKECDTPIRKITHKVRTGENLPKDMTIKMRCGNEKCVEFMHFEYKKIGHAHKGMKHTPLTLKKISEASRKRIAKLDIEKVREIRASKENRSELAKRYNVSHVAITAVISGRNWREDYGMFSGLIRNENRSAA